MNVFFDLDGTLYQTEFAIIHAVKALFDELGISAPSDNRILECVGKRTDMFLKAILPENIRAEDVREHFRSLDHDAVLKLWTSLRRRTEDA